MAEKKKKKKEQPEVPSSSFDTGTLNQPVTAEEFTSLFDEMAWRQPQLFEEMMKKQLQYAGDYTEAQRYNTEVMYRQAAQQSIQFAPQFAAAEQGIINQYAPEFGPTYSALGGRINEGLTAGYELGDELSREVEQSIRGAQTARGNYLGPAPTAQEAMGKGSAMIDLYNQRIGQAQDYLQGANPIQLMAQAGSATNLGQPYYGVSPVDQGDAMAGASAATSGAASAFGTIAGSETGFNNALLGAFSQNSENMFNTYDRTYEQYLEELAIEQGLFSQPSVSSGGGSGMAIAGSAIGAVGAIGGGLLAF
jgi:hypothetical protein